MEEEIEKARLQPTYPRRYYEMELRKQRMVSWRNWRSWRFMSEVTFAIG
jgi:hypothetical protein